jgi:hypothetical protein
MCLSLRRVSSRTAGSIDDFGAGGEQALFLLKISMENLENYHWIQGSRGLEPPPPDRPTVASAAGWEEGRRRGTEVREGLLDSKVV